MGRLAHVSDWALIFISFINTGEYAMDKPRGRLIAGALLAMLVGFGTSLTVRAAVMTDIIMVVDESGSMGDVQANLRNNIGAFASILSSGGIDARYGLVGYGSGSVAPRMLTNLTTPTAFSTAAQNLLINGGTEPGYTATAFALNALDGQSDLFSFRSNALTNIILFTDEPHNGTSLSYGTVGGVSPTFSIADQLLTDNNALFNAVLDYSDTIASYGPLASAHGGNVYDLSQLNTTDTNVVDQFVQNFAQSKLQEIMDYCTLHPNDPGCTGGGDGSTAVPEPGVFALLFIGLLGFGAARLSRN